MNKKFIAVLSSAIMALSFSSLKAQDINFGFSLMAGQTDVSGSEKENGSASDKNSASREESFYGGSLFVEFVADNGYAIGLDYIPLDIEVGSGKRTDTSTGASATSEADTGTRSASASLEDLMTLYANVPFGNDYYGLVGYHMVTVTTDESLPSSSYGSDDITGYQVGLGKRGDGFKIEVFYSDFDDISLTATGGKGSHKIDADADAMGVKLSFHY